MGKASRKMNKKIQRSNQQAAGSELRQQMKEQESALEYAKAIETLAELVEKKLVTAEDMYAGARDYFMLGDYTRSGQCVNSVLTMAPDHISARILLGRLCLNEERIDDALAIYDFVLKNFAAQLTHEQQEEIQDALRYYERHEPERLKQEYAACYAFLENYESSRAGTDESLKKAAESIARMKKKLTSSQLKTEPKQEKSFLSAQSDSAVQEKQEVLAQEISLSEKVDLLNRFAGAHYYGEDYSGARELLTAALKIDAVNEMSLRNMAILLLELGEKDRAAAFAGKLAKTDFMLLRQLKK